MGSGEGACPLPRLSYILLPRYLLVKNFYSFHLNEQRHLAWHMIQLKLYRELSAARCLKGIPMALIAAKHEDVSAKTKTNPACVCKINLSAHTAHLVHGS